MDLGLKGKIAVVTGGTRGIGRAVVGRLVEEGCAVALCARSADAVEATVSELGRDGATLYGARCDVTEAGAVEAFVAATAESLGGVDLLVANIGKIVDSTPSEEEAAKPRKISAPRQLRRLPDTVSRLVEVLPIKRLAVRLPNQAPRILMVR